MPRTRKETPIQARKSARESTLTPFYAVAGLTDALAEGARSKLNETQERAETLQSRAKQNADDLARFIADLPAHLMALPQTTRDRAGQLSEQASSYRTEASSRYEDLAGRGKRRVDEAVSTAQTLSGRARKTTESGLKSSDPLFETVQEAATRLRKRATGRTATDTVTPKTAASTPSERPIRKATAKKTTAKTAAARTTAAKSTGTKNTGTKSTAAKTTATKSPARKSPAKKSGARSANA